MRILSILFCLAFAAPAFAQGTTVPFGGLKQDPSLPVEINAAELSVDQTDNSAIFSGGVTVTQGEVKLTADTIRVVYAPAVEGQPAKVSQLEAGGGVTLNSGEAVATAEKAIYDINTGNVVMTGGISLLQGPTSVTGDRMTVNLTSGTGQIEGNVRTILTPTQKP
ncbi:MAG: LptA/OstA family protein [Deltaproteobacteria bacterium]